MRWLVVGALVSIALLVAGLRLREWLLAEALLRDVERLSRTRELPTLREHTAGTFNTCLSRVLDTEPVPRVLRPLSGLGGEKDVRQRVLDGEAPLASLDASDRAALEGARTWVEHVLTCARSPRLAPDTRIGPFADELSARLRPLMTSVPTAAAFVVRAALDAGAPDAAVERCIDSAAFTRDVMTFGPQHQSPARDLLRGVLRPCVDALDAASPETKRRFVGELSLIASSTPTFAEVMEIERARVQLAAFARFTDSQRARLPVGTRSRRESLRLDPLQRLRWRDFVRSFDDVLAVSALPRAARDTELPKVVGRHESVFDQWAPLTSANALFLGIAHLNDESHDLFAFLVRVARVDLRELPWPTDSTLSLSLARESPIVVTLEPD